ncbi:MAG TPA: hypothetical protein VHE56_03810 [Mycobacteriales bacterium]|nr:hypothetical protein [Mycobacteriales bacterium]
MRTAWDRHQERQAHFLPVARRVTELEELPPGPALITGLRELRATPMTEELALRCVVQWERCESWLAAQKMVMLGEADRVGAERPLLAQELAALTNTAFSAAMGQLGLTDQVARALGSAWSALERGELTLSHVKALGRAVERFPVSVAQLVDEALVPLAIERRWTPAELRRAARRAAIDADPDGAADRAERAKAESDVLLYPRDDDMAGLDAHGDAATMQRVMDVINRDAEQLRRDGDRRPIGVRRITALANAVLGKAAADRPTVQTMVTVDLSTYLGLTNRPGELSGYGPITAELARQLSQDAELVRLITDPIEGTVVDVGRRSYRPTRLVRRIVEALHPVCAFAGCNRRAVSCDKDHRQDWREGGHTSTCNLQPLCRRHHNLKSACGAWTSTPTGLRCGRAGSASSSCSEHRRTRSICSSRHPTTCRPTLPIGFRSTIPIHHSMRFRGPTFPHSATRSSRRSPAPSTAWSCTRGKPRNAATTRSAISG